MSIGKTRELMITGELIDVCCGSYTNYVNTLCDKMQSLLVWQQAIYVFTNGLWKFCVFCRNEFLSISSEYTWKRKFVPFENYVLLKLVWKCIFLVSFWNQIQRFLSSIMAVGSKYVCLDETLLVLNG